MGGTLDPIHEGHLRMAMAAREAAALDKVLLLPTGNPPHKKDVTPGQHRWAMICAAAAPYSWLEPDATELER